MEQLRHVTGLRAYAVIPVLLFHLGISSVSGGFVGVDAFFVISGFLITGILVKEVKSTGRIDFLRFYTRRARRLLPALFVTLAVTFALSAVILSPDHLAPAAKSTIAAIFSGSNILFWQEAGYFDVSKATKPLLHTWSLGVEMQFYFVWPAIILLTAKIAPRSLLAVICFAGLLSFAGNYLTKGDALFFLTPFRVFEFAIGGLVVWTMRWRNAPPWLPNFGVIGGLIFLLAPVFLLNGSEPYPRHYALLPCIGTALLIQFGASRVGATLLSNPLAVGIGEISYSLYLVHWPLIVFNNYWKFTDRASATDQWVLAVASFILAIALYFLIERPFRQRASQRPLWIWLSAGVASLAISSPAISAARDGWATRHDKFYPVAVRHRERLLDEETKDICRIEVGITGNCDWSKPRRILMIGDSHLRAMSYAFRESLPDTQIINLSYRGCHEAFVVENGRAISSLNDDFCAQKAAFINSDHELFKTIDAVVLASYRPFSYHANLFRFDLLDLVLSKTNGAPSIVVGDYFQTDQSRPCSTVVHRRRSIDACMEKEFATYVGTLKQVSTEPLFAEHGRKYEFLDIASLFCPKLVSCPGSWAGAPFLFDSDHLTPSFNKHIIETIVKEHSDYLIKVGILAR